MLTSYAYTGFTMLSPGEEIGRWKRAYRVQDLAVAAGGSVLVIAASDKHIHLLR